MSKDKNSRGITIGLVVLVIVALLGGLVVYSEYSNNQKLTQKINKQIKFNNIQETKKNATSKKVVVNNELPKYKEAANIIETFIDVAIKKGNENKEMTTRERLQYHVSQSVADELFKYFSFQSADGPPSTTGVKNLDLHYESKNGLIKAMGTFDETYSDSKYVNKRYMRLSYNTETEQIQTVQIFKLEDKK